MDKILDLLKLTDAYCERAGIAEATLSSRLFMDGKRLKAIRGGSDVGVLRLDRAIVWLSDHWPIDLEWPNDVLRPAMALPLEAAE